MASKRQLEWGSPEALSEIENWARAGLSDRQIAHNMGISRSTLHEWRRENKDIDEAIKSGKGVIDAEVENALLKRATGFSYKEIVREYVRDRNTGKMELRSRREFVRTVPPDVSAQKFWLKNRNPDAWKTESAPYDFDMPVPIFYAERPDRRETEPEKTEE